MLTRDLFETDSYGPGDSQTWPKSAKQKKKIPYDRSSPSPNNDDKDVERREKQRQGNSNKKFDATIKYSGKHKHEGATYSKWTLTIDADSVGSANSTLQKWRRVDNQHSFVLSTNKDGSGPRSVQYVVQFINGDAGRKGSSSPFGK